MHIKDRGNVALPTDIVKVLKTQDENYVRTVRAAGLKVRISYFSIFCNPFTKYLQKIDRLKNKLTEMADLMKPSSLDEQAEDDLEQGELQTLIDAGIISGRSRPGRKGKHIVFVENEAEGAFSHTRPSFFVDLKKYAAHNYRPMQSSSSTSEQAIVEGKEIDLGWKSTSTKKNSQTSKRTPEGLYEVQDAITPGDERKRLLKELAARLVRDQQLRYTQREFEMQRLMMGKGGRKKIMGAEKVEGDSDSEEDEDEVDARKGKPRKASKTNNETYKPRVYKWHLERKR